MTYISVQQRPHEGLESKPTSLAQNTFYQLVDGLIARFRLMQNRKHLVTLRNMSAQHLLDMGLDHGDLVAASRLSSNVDVTHYLACIARQRCKSVQYTMSQKCSEA